MKFVYVILIAGVRRHCTARGCQGPAAPTGGRPSPRRGRVETRRLAPWPAPARCAQLASRSSAPFGDVGLVAVREIKERVRGRIFRVGTVLVLLVVGAAIIIPTLHHGGGSSTQTVGDRRKPFAGSQAGRGSSRGGEQGLDPVCAGAIPRRGRGPPALGESRPRHRRLGTLLLNRPAAGRNSPADPGLVQNVAQYLGVLKAYQTAGLTPAQAAASAGPSRCPSRRLESGATETTRTVSVIGLVDPVLHADAVQHLDPHRRHAGEVQSGGRGPPGDGPPHPAPGRQGAGYRGGGPGPGHPHRRIRPDRSPPRWAPTCCTARRRWCWPPSCCGCCSATPSTAGSTPRADQPPNARTRCRRSPCLSASRS